MEQKRIEKWAGKSIEWFMIEIIVYFTYCVTMIILVLKSRFKKVGYDNISQFEPHRMKLMVNQIINDI